jgi:hypothetical protein
MGKNVEGKKLLMKRGYEVKKRDEEGDKELNI